MAKIDPNDKKIRAYVAKEIKDIKENYIEKVKDYAKILGALNRGEANYMIAICSLDQPQDDVCRTAQGNLEQAIKETIEEFEEKNGGGIPKHYIVQIIEGGRGISLPKEFYEEFIEKYENKA